MFAMPRMELCALKVEAVLRIWSILKRPRDKSTKILQWKTHMTQKSIVMETQRCKQSKNTEKTKSKKTNVNPPINLAAQSMDGTNNPAKGRCG